MEKIPHYTYILSNEEYNKMQDEGNNMNKIKSILHNKVIMGLLKSNNYSYDMVVIDQFTPKRNYYNYLKDEPNVFRKITFTTKAEDKCLSVGVSSIISRYLFLKEMEKLSKEIGISFSSSAKKHGMTVQTCYEEETLIEYGFIKGECLSHELAYQLTGKSFPNWKARNCNCVEMVDVGSYNTCNPLCKYCYANFDEKQVQSNIKKHNPNSSLLIGEIEKDDIIKERYK